jgi:hypothetical protein
LPELFNGGSEPGGGKENDKAGKTDNNDVRMATARQVEYIKNQIKKKNISQEEFLKEWEDYFESFEDIPFNIVNDILEWIREQS